MKQLLVVLAVIIIATISCKDELKDMSKAEMAVLKDSVNFTTVKWLDTAVNFGTAKLGEKIQIKFRCQNTGKKPLVIINARPGCGCTVANYTKQPIAPGEEGLVTAEFDTQKAHGTSVTKYIIVTTNTPNADVNLMFKGEIIGGESNDKIAVPHEVHPPRKS